MGLTWTQGQKSRGNVDGKYVAVTKVGVKLLFQDLVNSTVFHPVNVCGGWAPLARDLQEKGGTDG